MNTAAFRLAGATLWGPQYKSEMARQLGVNLRTLMRWDGGEHPVPGPIGDKLVKLLKKRQTELERVLAKVEAA